MKEGLLGVMTVERLFTMSRVPRFYEIGRLLLF